MRKIVFWLILGVFYAYPQEPNYFDTTFLREYKLVAKALIEKEGFKKVSFTSSDGVELGGLFLERPNATCTVIFCTGFYPGRKESLAPHLKLVPNNCNLLFLDARGHGDSAGPFISSLHSYGKNEYKDVVAALDFIQSKNNLPIIMHGTCAGTFHISRALIRLHQTSNLEKYNIKGFIFDSGVTSIMQASHAVPHHLKEKTLAQLLTLLYKHDTKKEVKKRLLYKLLRFTLASSMDFVRWSYEQLFIKHYEEETKLANKMDNIACPVLFIHSYDDTYVPISIIMELADETKQPTCWWIEQPSSHTNHHLKYPKEYQKRLVAFFDEILHT